MLRTLWYIISHNVYETENRRDSRRFNDIITVQTWMTQTPKTQVCAQWCSEVLCNASESAATYSLISLQSRGFSDTRCLPRASICRYRPMVSVFRAQLAGVDPRSRSLCLQWALAMQAPQLIRVRILNACRISFRELSTARDRLPRAADQRFVSGDFGTKLISWWHASRPMPSSYSSRGTGWDVCRQTVTSRASSK